MNIYKKTQILEAENMFLRDENKKKDALIDYLSMMTDVEIPEEEEEEYADAQS